MTDSWTASVCTQLDQQQTFLGLDNKNGKKTITISKEICSTQSRSKKVQEKKSLWVLKQKLFDSVPESECAGEKVRARLVVREIERARSEDEKLEASDVLSAMPPVESLKALSVT